MSLKYKVGDKVKINSIDWYNKNKNENGIINIGIGLQNFGWNRVKYCGKTLTIRDIYENTAINLSGQIVKIQFYLCSCDDIPDADGLYWSDEMIECKMEE